MKPQRTAADKEARTGATKPIQAVERAISILDALSLEPDGLALTELARRVQLSPQATLNFLRTLQAQGLVVQRGRGQPYGLGPRLLQLAARVQPRQLVIAAAREPLLRLAGDLREYVMLAALQDARVIRLLDVPVERSLAVRAESESHAHVHAMSTGKVLLAYLPLASREAFLAQLTLPRLTEKTLSDPAALRVHLDNVQRQGYAETVEEAVPGVAALAVPVHLPDGSVTTAIGCCLPLVRYTVRRRQTVLDALRETATAVEQALRP